MADTENNRSSTHAPASRRPPTKRRLVVTELEREIRAGVLQPGEQLASHAQLAKRFHTGSMTIRAAIDELVARGLIETIDRSGTFVVEHLPYTNRYAMVFPDRPSEDGWVYFWVALVNEARRITETGPLTIDVYYQTADTESPDRQRLEADVETGTLAGIIFPIAPDWLQGTPILETPNIPLVTVHGEYEGIPGVLLDNRGLIERGLRYMREAGVHRLAVVSKGNLPARTVQSLNRLSTELDMEMPEHWTLPLPDKPKVLLSRVTRLLMNGRERERPDGVFILDDNLVEGCTAGLFESGVRAPDDVTVLAHANFPWPTPSLVGITRIGFDVRQVMAGFLTLLRTRGEQSMQVPAMFESELPTDVEFDMTHAPTSSPQAQTP